MNENALQGGSQASSACVSPGDGSWHGWMTSHASKELQGDVDWSPVGNRMFWCLVELECGPESPGSWVLAWGAAHCKPA